MYAVDFFIPQHFVKIRILHRATSLGTRRAPFGVNIANGKYFMVGNRLFLSTSAIAQGASIVVGTNCVESNLAEALNALNA